MCSFPLSLPLSLSLSLSICLSHYFYAPFLSTLSSSSFTLIEVYFWALGKLLLIVVVQFDVDVTAAAAAASVL